jgi:hypothetical protein
MKRISVICVALVAMLMVSMAWGDEQVSCLDPDTVVQEMITEGFVWTPAGLELITKYKGFDGYKIPRLRQWGSASRITPENPLGLFYQKIDFINRTVEVQPDLDLQAPEPLTSASCAAGNQCFLQNCSNGTDPSSSFCMVQIVCPDGTTEVGDGDCVWENYCNPGQPQGCDCNECVCEITNWPECPDDPGNFNDPPWYGGGGCEDPVTHEPCIEYDDCIPADSSMSCAWTNSCNCQEPGDGWDDCPLCLGPNQ